MADPVVVINSRKYDGTIRKTWTCEMIERTGSRFLFKGVFDTDIVHTYLGAISKGTVSYEHYWLDRWYSVFRFYGPDGQFRNYYCNINTPPTFDGRTLNYVDLDIDIVVWPDLSYEILDLVEFEDSAAIYGYTAELRRQVSSAQNELIMLIETGGLPI